jgi:hypothetical protein
MLMLIHPVTGEVFLIYTGEIIHDPRARGKRKRKPPKRKRVKH